MLIITEIGRCQNNDVEDWCLLGCYGSRTGKVSPAFHRALLTTWILIHGGRKLLRNVGNYLQIDTTPHPGKSQVRGGEIRICAVALVVTQILNDHDALVSKLGSCSEEH
jgi:hypothetical protein